MIALGMVTMVVAPVSPANADAPVGEPCTYHEMTMLQDGDSINVLTAADPSGRYQIGVRGAWLSPSERREELIIWHDGTPELGPRLDTIGAEFVAVGPTGTAVGFFLHNGERRAVSYTDGRIMKLAAPIADEEFEATAVNARGQAAGDLFTESGDRQALAWSPDGEVRTLATPEGFTSATATQIDADGTVLGYATAGRDMTPDRENVVVWPADGTPRVLLGTTPDALTWPIDIHDGVVYGLQNDELLRWDHDGTTPTVIDAGGVTSVKAVNTRGSVLGVDRDGPVLLRDGTRRPLWSEFTNITPVGLSDNDVVFGRSNVGGVPAYYDCR
jgi:hypothetical protein